MKNKTIYSMLTFFKYTALVILLFVFKLFLYSIIIGKILNSYHALDLFLTAIIILFLFLDNKSKRFSKMFLASTVITNILVSVLFQLLFIDYLSNKFHMISETIIPIYKDYIFVLIIFFVLFFLFDYVINRLISKKITFKIDSKIIKKTIFYIFFIAVLLFIYNIIDIAYTNNTSDYVRWYAYKMKHNIAIDHLYKKIKTVRKKSRTFIFYNLLDVYHDYEKDNIKQQSIVQDVKLIFIYSLFSENLKELIDYYDFYMEELNFKYRSIYYTTFLHNTAGDYFNLTRVDSIYSDYIEIPDIKSYVKENVKKEESLKIMKSFAKKIISFEPYLVLGYAYLIDLNYQEGNIKEAIEYYNIAVSLKVPEDLPEEEIQYIESSKEKIKEIYNPLLKEK